MRGHRAVFGALCDGSYALQIGIEKRFYPGGIASGAFLDCLARLETGCASLPIRLRYERPEFYEGVFYSGKGLLV